ncbi:alpha/beta hydrolase [Streptomyces sp. NPDC006617]|uniref:alpha/beta hydrolase n=1 Tax=Streptomyces sp. NPDC006617 TaxID=3155354 RepID=UPI0033A6C9BA
MTMQRRSFLTLSAAGAAGVGMSLLGTGHAGASARAGAPTQRFAVGVRQYAWSRGSRRWTTYVYYPATGGSPVCEFMHGFSSSPQKSLTITRPLAEAGFIVPAPHFANLSGQDVYNGNQSKVVSEVITRTLALNTADDPLAGHINTALGVGASGHSMGGMTTHGLLTSWPDARITAAIPMSCVDMGNPSPAVRAKVLFTHGDRDGTCPISSARQAYRELPPPRRSSPSAAPATAITSATPGPSTRSWTGCGGVCTATPRPATTFAPTPPPARPPGNPP